MLRDGEVVFGLTGGRWCGLSCYLIKSWTRIVSNQTEISFRLRMGFGIRSVST